MEEFVVKIVKRTYGIPPSFVGQIKGKGKSNLVFKILVNGTPLILRLSNRDKTLELYEKEKWCAEAAKKAGVSTPKILEVGEFDGYAFSFQEYLEGVQGNDIPQEVGNISFALGQQAKKIHSILTPTLRLDYKKFIGGLFENDYFLVRGVFSKELSEKIESRLKETYEWKFSSTLCHGNLAPSNVIVDPDGAVNVIDWETATGNRNPQSELAEIYTWNTGKDNIARFMEGYGITEEEVMAMMRDIQTLVLLRLVHVIVRKMPKDGDWKQDNYIQETALRLAGISDYSQDILFTKNL